MAHNMYVLLPSEEGLRSCCSVLFRVLVFTGLVCNTAAGLACALAGSLALAAAALDSALCHITGIQCHDMLHVDVLSLKNIQSLHFYQFTLLMNRRMIPPSSGGDQKKIRPASMGQWPRSFSNGFHLALLYELHP